MLRALTENLNRTRQDFSITSKTPEKIATPNQISPLATPESSLIINQKFTDPTSHFEEYAALLTPFQNRTEVKKLQATIKDLALEISKAEQREFYAIEKKNISADKKERLIDTQTFIHGYAATKTIKNEIAKLATKLEQKNDPELAKLSETLRDLETLMRATAHQFKGMAIAQSLENHVIYEKKNNYAILENTGLPNNEVKSSTSLDFKIGVSSKIVSNTPLAKAGVNFGVSEKSTKTTTRDGFNSFSQKHERQVELKLSGNVNFATAAGKIEVGASRTLSNDNYKADSLDKIIKHNAVTSNDGRLNISNPKFQPYYQALATLRNICAPLINGKPVNPDFPHYLTSNALTYINSSHVTIKTILDKYGIRPEIEPELNINQIDSLTKGNVAPSKGKLTAVKSNPDTKTTLSVQAEVGVTNSAPLLFKDHPRQLLAANMTPKMGGMASLAYAIEFADSQALTLKPSHEFLSTTYTHDIGESLKQANDALSHWKNKQLDKALPPHLQDTQVLFEKSAMSIAPNMLTQHIDAACHALDQLKANFTEFKAAAQQFMDLTHHSVNFESPAYKQKYNQLLSTIQTHQFDVDKLSMIPLDQVEKYGASEVKKPSREQAQELIGKVWDSYSTALGILEQGAVAPFKQLDTLTQTQKNEFVTDFPTLPEQLENFSQKHEQTTKELANPGLPLALERLYRYASLKMPIHTGKITQTFKGEGSITQNLNPHLGALDRVAGTVSIKKSTPTKVTNPLENISTTTMTKSIKENHLFFQDNAKIVDQMTNLVGINHTGTQKALKEMLVLQRNAMIQQGVQQSMSPQVKKNKVIRGLRTMRDRYHNLTQAKSAEFSITHAGGQTQKIKLASTAESTGSMGWPHLMKSNNLGVSASLHRNRNLAYTKTEITMMGPEFTQNLSNFKNMEEFGLDKTALKSIKENMMHPDGRNTDALKAQFAKFFESAQINPPIRQHYFGMNALGEFLMQFSDIKTEEKVEKDDNGSFKLSGFNLFHQNVTDSYFEKKSAEKLSAKNILSVLTETNTSNNIFEKTGTDPVHVKQLLESKICGKDMNTSVAQFLNMANDRQRMQFFQEEKIGIELFAAYLLILNQAKDIKDVFTENTLHHTGSSVAAKHAA